MFQVAEDLAGYRLEFERFTREHADRRPEWISRMRTAAFDRFVELGFPTTRIEEWKYTNVAPIAKTPFRRAAQAWSTLSVESIEPFTLEKSACAQLVFVNGYYTPELSFFGKLPEGVMVSSLATVLTRDPAAVEPHLARYADHRNQAFVALNTALMEDGAFVSIPQETVMEKPIHLLFVSSACSDSTQDRLVDSAQGGSCARIDDEAEFAAVSYPRNVFVVGSHSQVRIVESHVGVRQGVYCTNAVTEIVGGDSTVIDYYKVQQESKKAFHVATVQAQLGCKSAFSSCAIDLGGALVRNGLNVALDGEGAECDLNGVYVVTGRQHVDNHTRIDHIRPHCSSRQLYKGILDEQSRGVFNGKVVVHKSAKKSDARQVNKNLLLSGDAVIDSKPQLEIFNDDVKCTHGATIGQHNQDAIFYLRSRGIDPSVARSLLTYAFASELLGRIGIEPIRAGLEALLLARLGHGSIPEEAS